MGFSVEAEEPVLECLFRTYFTPFFPLYHVNTRDVNSVGRKSSIASFVCGKGMPLGSTRVARCITSPSSLMSLILYYGGIMLNSW